MTRGKAGQYSGREVARDPFFSSVVLLIHANGSGSTFVDSSASAKTVEVFGSATQVSSPSVFGNAAALSFSGSQSGRLSVADSDDFFFGSADFTIEGFFRPSELPSDFQSRRLVDHQNALMLLITQSFGVHNVALYVPDSSGTGLYGQNVAYTTSTTQFTHFAAVRQGNTLSLYADGSRLFSTGISGSVANLTGPLKIADTFTGTTYLDEFRITKGVARYTGTTVTVPSTQFADA